MTGAAGRDGRWTGTGGVMPDGDEGTRDGERCPEMEAQRWHVPEEDVRAYARGALPPPRLWSAETHLAGCGECRGALSRFVDPAMVEEGWARLDAELDAPRPGLLEWALLRLGVTDHTARLLAATSTLRRAWLGSVLATLVLAVFVANATASLEAPLFFLATAPLLPLAGVALSFGPRLDPTYEMALVAPMHNFRLLMVRTVAVLVTSTALSALASLALPSFGLITLGWLLPALALTATGLALMPGLGTLWAPLLVGTGWTVAVVCGDALSGGTPAPFTEAGQLVAAVAAVVSSVALASMRDRFDSSRFLASGLPRPAR